jgi:rsbT co-antagonist protein RsbR
MIERGESTVDGGELMQAMRLGEDEVGLRKRYLQFGEDDERRLTELNELATQYAEPVIEAFYQHLMSFRDTKAFFKDTKTLERVKRMQLRYFLSLTQGSYDRAYVSERLKIGAVHERIGLEPKFYLGSYNFYLREVASRLFDVFAHDPRHALETYLSLMKLVFLDIGLAIDTYTSQRERTIARQQEAIRVLSTPVLQVREGLLILPIVGEIDRQRARQLTEQLLHSIRSRRAQVVVIDITGVPAVDSSVASRLVQTVEAARLMGAATIVTGLSAEVAQALVDLGAELGKLNTVGDLQGGIELAERMLGYQIESVDGAPDGQLARSQPTPG